MQWSRVNGPAVPFEYVVMITRDRLVAAPTNSRLPAPAERSLANVLRALHREEANEEYGAWMFARVTSDGVVVGFDRAFDSWPWWFQLHDSSEGPSLEDLPGRCGSATGTGDPPGPACSRKPRPWRRARSPRIPAQGPPVRCAAGSAAAPATWSTSSSIARLRAATTPRARLGAALALWVVAAGSKLVVLELVGSRLR